MPPLANVPYAREGIILAFAVALFLISGAEAVIAFLQHDAVHEVLGTVATLLALFLGIYARPRATKSEDTVTIPHPPHDDPGNPPHTPL